MTSTQNLTETAGLPTTSFDCAYCAFTASVDANKAERGEVLRPRRTCRYCAGTGTITFEPTKIAKAILVTRGERKGQLLRSAPGDSAPFGARTVWRLVRFNLGQDVCLPVMCWDHVGVIGILDANAKAVMAFVEGVAAAASAELAGERALTGRSAWHRVMHGSDLAGLDTSGIGNGTDRREDTNEEW